MVKVRCKCRYACDFTVIEIEAGVTTLDELHVGCHNALSINGIDIDAAGLVFG